MHFMYMYVCVYVCLLVGKLGHQLSISCLQIGRYL